MLISFEGLDRSGKSTQLLRIARVLRRQQFSVTCIQEPGATPLGARLRRLLLHARQIEIAPMSEVLLFAADRAETYHLLAEPALARNAIVLLDRDFDSMLAYQGFGRGIDRDYVERISLLATAGRIPDVTFLFDIDPQVAAVRREPTPRQATGENDRFEAESLEFKRRVREGYLTQARGCPARVHVIDANQERSRITQQVLAVLAEKLDCPALVRPANRRARPTT